MHEPYFPDEKIANEFFYLIGRIIVAWSAVERAVDLMLFTSGIFHPKDGTAIVSWKKKTKALRALFEANPETNRKWINDTVDKLNEMAGIRNAIIHGYCNGATDSEPPKIMFRAAKYNSETIDTKQLNLSIENLVEFFKDIEKMNENLVLNTIRSVMHPKRKSEKGG